MILKYINYKKSIICYKPGVCDFSISLYSKYQADRTLDLGGLKRDSLKVSTGADTWSNTVIYFDSFPKGFISAIGFNSFPIQ